jgi:hypothetical protein
MQTTASIVAVSASIVMPASTWSEPTLSSA